MSTRNAEIARFLATCGWGQARRTTLAGDASPRRYLRLRRTGAPPQHAVLMDADPTLGQDVGPFLDIDRFLRHAGFAAPGIMAAERDAGLVLMEDLGDALFARVCADAPQIEPALYASAIDVLAALYSVAPPAHLPDYTREDYLREARLAIDWYLPAATGRPTSDATAREYCALVSETVEALLPTRTCCVLRDYHAENLLWLPERSGISRVGLLDFQDALAGHPAYDVISLLEDARRDVEPALAEQMIRRFLSTTNLDEQSFRHACATLGAQRNLKIIGIFTRLFLRDGKPAYLQLIPRVWGHLMTDLRHPVLAHLSAFVTQTLPAPTPDILQKIREGQNA